MNFSRGKQSVSELLKNCFIEANPALEIFERKIFIRRMCAAIVQRESHEQHFDAQHATELCDTGIPTAYENKRSAVTKGFTHPDRGASEPRAQRTGDMIYSRRHVG